MMTTLGSSHENRNKTKTSRIEYRLVTDMTAQIQQTQEQLREIQGLLSYFRYGSCAEGHQVIFTS